MLSNVQLYAFSDLENQQYNMQKTLLSQFALLGARDSLIQYSCHSQRHVTEVMENCDMLWSAMQPYVQACFPQAEMNPLRELLLLGAKLHDIGMCGTEAQRRLLLLADEMYACLMNGKVDAAFAAQAQQMTDLIGTAHLTDRCFRDWQYFCAMGPSNVPIAKLRTTLLAMHDRVKHAIRKYHAAQSGMFVLQHADIFEKQYVGADISVAALLAMMHSGFMDNQVQLAPDTPQFDEILTYVNRVLSTFGREMLPPDRLKQLLVLASVLRWADTRRSGIGTHALSDQPMALKVDGERAVAGLISPSGIFQPVLLSDSNEILRGEMCTEFEQVELRKVQHEWHMVHHIALSHAGSAQVRDAFVHSRMPTYLEDVMEHAFAPAKGFNHQIHVHLVQGTPAQSAEMKQRMECAPWQTIYPCTIKTDVR